MQNINMDMYYPFATNLRGKLNFLEKQVGLKYPRNWYLTHPKATCTIYKKAHAEYTKQFRSVGRRELDVSQRVKIEEFNQQMRLKLEEVPTGAF